MQLRTFSDWDDNRSQEEPMPNDREHRPLGFGVVTASSYVIDTHFLRLRKDTIELPDGSVIEDYYVRESRGFAMVCAITQDNRIVLVRQYKHGIGQELLELPAGAIDPGEEPSACAMRELEEETGYTAPAMEFVRTFIVDPTNSNSVAHLFLARNAEKTSEQTLDVTERIDVELVALHDLLRLVRNGTIESISHVGAIYVLLDLLDNLH
jgi:8-oxo-dGTP pyrophosphatase MutT (NUDIX family)